jgi:hypothetical protein
MTYKSAMTNNKLWIPTEAQGFSLAGLFTRLQNAVKLSIPVGYQDETGFHAGIQPAKKETAHSSDW